MKEIQKSRTQNKIMKDASQPDDINKTIEDFQLELEQQNEPRGIKAKYAKPQSEMNY